MNFHIGFPEWPFRTAIELIRCIFSLFHLFQKKKKISTEKSNAALDPYDKGIPEKVLIESVVANVLKFDILLPNLAKGIAPQVFF